MPFTFAHPAAVLWCARWHPAGVPFSAFVIGSKSPDFEYFLRLANLAIQGIVGLFVALLIAGYSFRVKIRIARN